MADLPRHPETSDSAEGAAAADRASTRPWLGYAVGIVVAAVFVLVIVLHLTGAVGPGAH